MLGLRIVGEFGFIIAAPVVLLAAFGKWLDTRYDTAPLFLVIGFLLAAVLSAVSVYRRAKSFGEEYQAIDQQGSESESKPAAEEPAESQDNNSKDLNI